MTESVNWTQVLVAFAVGLPATITAAGAVFLSLKNSWKIDDNTNITKSATEEAATNAKIAADRAADARNAAQILTSKLDESLDDRITKIVKLHTDVLAKQFEEHNDQDEKNMLEIRNAIIDLRNSLNK